jgi:hypothetical protein
LQARLEPTRIEPLTGLHSIGSFLAFPTNIRLEWKRKAVVNTLAYYDMDKFTALEKFKFRPPVTF